MDIRYPANPQDFETYTTERIRSEFLIQNLFTPGRLALTYSHADRMIVGGACPKDPIHLEAGKEMSSGSFLERREMGIINVGPQGTVTADGQQFILDKTDGLYIGQGTSDVSFSSTDPENPARYYLLSGPAHKNYPTQKTTQAEAVKASLGSVAEANVRTLYKYIHPGGIPSCQLVMGMTALETGSVWNSMPCHTHARRMEVYFYFNLPDDAIVFHLMGEPDETRHIVIRNEEAVISPDWSIHAGAGISNYIFIWGMIGENQTFTDMDVVNMAELQ